MILRSFFLLASLLLLGCGEAEEDGSASVPSTDEASFDVTWGPRTRVIDETVAKDLLLGDAPDADTLLYRFQPSASAIAQLQPGDVVVLSGVAYRKVVAVHDRGDAIELQTERTTLPEVISSGTLTWSRPVLFDSPQALQTATVDYGPESLRAVAQGLDGAISYEGEVGGFDVSVQLKPSPGRLELTLSASKSIAGEKRFAIVAEGFVSQFQTEGRVVIGEGNTLDFEAGATALEGEMKVKAIAFNAGASQSLLSIPLGINIPVQLGPVPLIVKVKANINATLELSVNESSSEAEVTFRFRSDQGVAVQGSGLRSTGRIEQADFADLAGGSASGVAAGMTACAEFPRLELALAGEFASVGLSQNNCASSFYRFDPACNEVRGSITGIGLASLGFFGVTLASQQVELYKRDKKLNIGSCD